MKFKTFRAIESGAGHWHFMQALSDVNVDRLLHFDDILLTDSHRPTVVSAFYVRQLADKSIALELESHRENLGQVAATHFREHIDLPLAITRATLAMSGKDGERALRQRAEALRGVIQRIECTFKATGQKGGGWGKKSSELARVTVNPLVGESATFFFQGYANVFERPLPRQA